MESKKRKRDLNYPRIVYHTKSRTFDRLLKGKLRVHLTNKELLIAVTLLEDSLEAMKEVVIKKLGLDASAVVRLAQLRQGTTVDLEDGKRDSILNRHYSTYPKYICRRRL